MEMAHIMMETKHFPNKYWAEAIETIVYIMNRFPTKSVNNKIPQEAWKNMNHSVSHLIFFVVLHMLMF